MGNLIFVEDLASSYSEKSSIHDGVNEHFIVPTFTSNYISGIISFWVYRNNTTNTERMIHARKTVWNANDQFLINVMSAGAGQALDINVRHRVGGTDNYNWFFNTSVGATTWYHIAVWHDGTNLKCYLDGVEITTITKTTTNDETQWLNALSAASITRWLFGAGDNGSVINPLNGLLDEVTVWNDSTAVTIAELADATQDISALTNYGTNCPHHYRCGEGSDSTTTVNDLGTAAENATWSPASSGTYSSNVP